MCTRPNIRLVLIPLVLLLHLRPSGLEAQRKWEASATMSLGTDFREMSSDLRNTQGEAKVSLRHQGKRLSLFGDIQATTIHQAVLETGFDMSTAQDKAFSMSEDISSRITSDRNLGIRWGASWLVRPTDTLSVKYQEDLSKNTKEKISIHMSQADVMGDIAPVLFSVSNQDARKRNRNHNLFLSWAHRFQKKGREIRNEFSMDMGRERVTDLWDVGDLSGELVLISSRSYRLTPHMKDNVFILKSRYKDPSFLDVSGMDAEMSLSLRAGKDHDVLSAANHVNQQWVDSATYRQDFRYSTLTITPMFHLSYNTDPWDVAISYTPEYFTSRLSNQTHKGHFGNGLISHLVTLYSGYRFSDRHHLSLSYERSVSRPTYLQICWFPRPGDYAHEVFEGNPHLKPSLRNRLAITYEVGKGDLKGTIEAGYTLDSRKIEKTFVPVYDKGIGIRRYTWVNGGRDATLNLSASMEGTFRSLRLVAEGNVRYFHGRDVDDEHTYSSDYSFLTEMSYTYRTWTLTLSGRYESDIRRTYTSKTSVVGCDVRLDKKFGKFHVFLEGRNLLDRTVTTMTYSLDGESIRSEMTIPYRRIFLAGLCCDW